MLSQPIAARPRLQWLVIWAIEEWQLPLQREHPCAIMGLTGLPQTCLFGCQSAIHQLPVTPTCLPAPLRSLAFCLFNLGPSQTFGLIFLFFFHFYVQAMHAVRTPLLQGLHLSVCLISPRCTFPSSPCTCATAELPARLSDYPLTCWLLWHLAAIVFYSSGWVSDAAETPV